MAATGMVSVGLFGGGDGDHTMTPECTGTVNGGARLCPTVRYMRCSGCQGKPTLSTLCLMGAIRTKLGLLSEG